MRTDSENDLMTNRAAANFLGVQASTLAKWRCLKQYKIPYLKVGRLVRYRRRALEQWLQKRTIAA